MSHGHRKNDKPITDADVEAMADEAERGYDVDELLHRPILLGPAGDVAEGVPAAPAAF